MFANRDKAVSGDAMRATAPFTILVAPGLDQILAKCNETYEQAADHGPASRCALRGSMSHQDFTAGFFGALIYIGTKWEAVPLFWESSYAKRESPKPCSWMAIRPPQTLTRRGTHPAQWDIPQLSSSRGGDLPRRGERTEAPLAPRGAVPQGQDPAGVPSTESHPRDNSRPRRRPPRAVPPSDGGDLPLRLRHFLGPPGSSFGEGPAPPPAGTRRTQTFAPVTMHSNSVSQRCPSG